MKVGTVLSALWLAVLLGCDPGQVACDQLETDLKRCGFPVDALDCTQLDLLALQGLSAQMDRHMCDLSSSGNDPAAVDQRLCLLGGWPCPGSPIPPPPPGPKARNPLVFVSGIDDTPVFDWNPNIRAAVLQSGYADAHHVTLRSWAPTADRAADLWQSLSLLQRQIGARSLNLICYAVAGLDCRYLVSPKGLFKNDPAGLALAQDAVASITTIATPHRGTRVADATLVGLEGTSTAAVLKALLGIDVPGGLPSDAALATTLDGLTLDALSRFNQEVPDQPGLYYQSYAGISTPTGQFSQDVADAVRSYCVDESGAPDLLAHPGTIDLLNPLLLLPSAYAGTIRSDTGRLVNTPSDGMVAVPSARWGHFRGCVPADHYDVIGQIGHTTRDPLTGFDARPFYVSIAADLALRGF